MCSWCPADVCVPYWIKDFLLTNIISHLFQRSRSWCYIQMPVSHKDVQKPWRPRCPETRKNCDWRYVFSFFCGKFYTILNVLVGYVSSKTNIVIFLVHLRRMGDVSYFGILLSNPRQCLVYRPDRMLVKERKLSSHLNTMFWMEQFHHDVYIFRSHEDACPDVQKPGAMKQELGN